jgi:hypothetical protein
MLALALGSLFPPVLVRGDNNIVMILYFLSTSIVVSKAGRGAMAAVAAAQFKICRRAEKLNLA